MKVAVITPYFKESEFQLKRCYESVKQQSQSIEIDHYFVADGHPSSLVETFDAKHIILPVGSADSGNTPRGIAGILIRNADIYDAACYLDADNFFMPEHLESLLPHLAQCDVLCTKRSFYDVNGRHLPGAYDTDENNLAHVDTNCLILSKSSFDALDFWPKIPRKVAYIGDRIFLSFLRRSGNRRFKFVDQRTVGYETQWKHHFDYAGMEPPGECRTPSRAEIEWLMTLEGVRTTVERIGFYPL
ncbi:MAG: hypothetical protein GC184_03365 [Rhizobiales bacterium]|nr:hypothetical protein [Hyphomicrobiales bacterium]